MFCPLLKDDCKEEECVFWDDEIESDSPKDHCRLNLAISALASMGYAADLQIESIETLKEQLSEEGAQVLEGEVHSEEEK